MTLRLTAALLSSLLALAGPAAAQTPVFPAGSRVGLVPPPNMVPARGVAGFRNPQTGAAILAVEMPAEAFPGLAATFTDEALKAQGFSLTRRDAPQIGGGKAILVTGQQGEGASSVPKSVLLASEPGMTVLVIGQLPHGAPEPDVAAVEAALKTVAFRPALSLTDQVGALPFRIGDLAGFRVVRTMAGNSVMMTDGPSDVVRQASQPLLLIAQSFGPAPGPEQREAFARSALVANNFIKEPVLERSQSFKQGGSDWHEIVARATETGTETPVVVMQTIRFEPDGYMRSVGIVDAKQRDAVLPRFRRIVDSLAPQQ
ncbi:hypothetical protein [Enterovirga sp.]|uniref:hypothetical protein n=1 Tax=Enterovirga sp. TaxID=2026350 RepID=UPI0026172F55|nr:hypothetical protein [Enterovirga sp.]MDB5591471.1 hypothetical protein [Enterovirga sp.]